MPLMTPEMWTIMENDPAWLKRMLRTPYRPDSSFIDMILNTEPLPHRVYYCADTGKSMHLDPQSYRWQSWPDGPSDCTWIVPGTDQ